MRRVTVLVAGAIALALTLPVFAQDTKVAVGYSGWLVVEAEQDPAVANPATYARLGFLNLSRAAAAAGL